MRRHRLAKNLAGRQRELFNLNGLLHFRDALGSTVNLLSALKSTR
jgi:hypothetical protein